MRLLFFIIIVTTLFSSCQDSNSNSNDKIIYSDMIEDPDDVNFGPAFKVITNRCIACHTSPYHDSWANLLTSESWKNTIFIEPGSADNSKLIQSMKNYNANSSMPQNAGAIPDAEYQLLRIWINGIQ